MNNKNQRHSWKPNIRLVDEEISRCIWNTKVHFRVYNWASETLRLRRLIANISRRHPEFAPGSICGIYGEKSGSGKGFYLNSLGFPWQYHSTVVLHTHISSRGWTMCHLVTAVQRRSLTPSKSTMYNITRVVSHRPTPKLEHHLFSPLCCDCSHTRSYP
jgi:hypothetical protein